MGSDSRTVAGWGVIGELEAGGTGQSHGVAATESVEQELSARSNDAVLVCQSHFLARLRVDLGRSY